MNHRILLFALTLLPAALTSWSHAGSIPLALHAAGDDLHWTGSTVPNDDQHVYQATVLFDESFAKAAVNFHSGEGSILGAPLEVFPAGSPDRLFFSSEDGTIDLELELAGDPKLLTPDNMHDYIEQVHWQWYPDIPLNAENFTASLAFWTGDHTPVKPWVPEPTGLALALIAIIGVFGATRGLT